MFISKGFLSKRQLSFKRILTLMIVLTICFIFTQSLLPPEIAAKESEVASDIVADILPSDSAAEQYAENHMDKVAHFAEFGLLGLLVSLYICAFAIKSALVGILSIVFNFVIAAFDETIQIFSGRMSDINDVMFDMLGFCAVSMVVYLVYYIFIKSKKKEI